MTIEKCQSDELPRWDCLNQADQQRLQAWTNEQLDLLEQPTSDDLQHEAHMLADAKYLQMQERHFGLIRGLGMVAHAIKDGDIQTVDRLAAKSAKLRRFAFQLLMHKRRPGRQKGERRPADLPETDRWALEDAADDVKRIRLIWTHYYTRQNRGEAQEPTAYTIAAERNGVDKEQLINFLKNRHAR